MENEVMKELYRRLRTVKTMRELYMIGTCINEAEWENKISEEQANQLRNAWHNAKILRVPGM